MISIPGGRKVSLSNLLIGAWIAANAVAAVDVGCGQKEFMKDWYSGHGVESGNRYSTTGKVFSAMAGGGEAVAGPLGAVIGAAPLAVGVIAGTVVGGIIYEPPAPDRFPPA